MAKLTFLGAMKNVGASGILLEDGANRIVMDYGIKVSDDPPSFPIPVEGGVTHAVVSHCHLDHSGAIPVLVKNNDLTKVYSTPVTKELTELLLFDSIKVNKEEGIELKFAEGDVDDTLRKFEVASYNKPHFLKNGVEIKMLDAGHIPGSAMPLITAGDKNLLYTGDMNTEDTKLVRGCQKSLPEINTLIIESTYGDRNHPDRESQEKELVNTVRETLANDGNTIISGFAVGRIDELLLVLSRYGIDYPVFVDGMAKKAITIINKYKNWLKDPKSLDKALEKVEYVNDEGDRRRTLKEPSVVLTTSGMLKGGPVIWYLNKLYSRKNCSLILSGFQVKGTPGNVLLETGQYVNEKYSMSFDVKMGIKRLDFSSHAGKDGLLDFIKNANPERVFCVHGDKTEEFAETIRQEGFEAAAPSVENRIFDF